MTRPDGSRVREIRRAKEWTQDELARRANLSRPYISAIENGQSVSKIVMHRVAKVLKVGFDEITLPREVAA
jgi:transcriptional regulator with XRE-family HTH domain